MSSDEMFFSPDMRSLRRGNRRAGRTPTCRPCMAWLKDSPDHKYYGVVMDVSPYGLRLRMLDIIPKDCVMIIQMMRDEEFKVPFAEPLEGTVVRVQEEQEGFVDHGILLSKKTAKRTESRPVVMPKKQETKAAPSRMYSLDITIGDRTDEERSGR